LGEGRSLLLWGLIVVSFGVWFGIWQFLRIKKLPAHQSMLDVAQIIYETCKTYLFQQGRFITVLFLIIGSAIVYYFLGLADMGFSKVLLILLWSVLGIAGSYGVAWFGIRINTLANARTSFASLRGKPWEVVNIPL